jgi:hypothetical protein
MLHPQTERMAEEGRPRVHLVDLLHRCKYRENTCASKMFADHIPAVAPGRPRKRDRGDIGRNVNSESEIGRHFDLTITNLEKLLFDPSSLEPAGLEVSRSRAPDAVTLTPQSSKLGGGTGARATPSTVSLSRPSPEASGCAMQGRVV